MSIFLVLIFSCLIYAGNIKETTNSSTDFNEAEYKIISKIISSLDFDINKDKERIRKLPLYERFIWNAFIWRFYNGNRRNDNLYFAKLNGIDFEEITPSTHKENLHFIQSNHSSDLVLNEFLSMGPPHKYFYSDKDLLWIEDLFLKTAYAPLRDTTFYILLWTKRISSKSDKAILDNLSKKEVDTLTSFEAKGRKKLQ